jgi:hypothetical protein
MGTVLGLPGILSLAPLFFILALLGLAGLWAAWPRAIPQASESLNALESGG